MSTPIQIPKKDGTVKTVYASNAVEAERFVQVMHELAAMLPALKALENDIRKHLAKSEQIGNRHENS
jgi:hypothetical protein